MKLISSISRRKSTIFGWGYNKHNCGYEIYGDQKGETPQQILENLDVQRICSGYSETLLLTKTGQLFTYGHNGILTNNLKIPQQFQIDQNIKDCDIDLTHAALLDKNNTLWIFGKLKNSIQIENAKEVHCGDGFTVILIDDNNGKQQIAIIALKNDPNLEYVFCGQDITTQPSIIYPVQDILKEQESKIRKIQVVGKSIVVLLENGAIFSWGDNRRGNIGQNRSILEWNDVQTDTPKLVDFKDNKIKNQTFIDFAMSDNILVVLTQEG